MYADNMTESMQVAIDETTRRRVIQEKYNADHGIVPQTIIKASATSTTGCGRWPEAAA
jgi:excinuclease ABC subunit B